MEVIGFLPIDWIIILIKIGFVLGIGLYLRKFTKSQEDCFPAGRRNSFLVAGLAYPSANLGALELQGITGNTFKYGM